MPAKSWVAGEELKAADINQYLQNQTVLPFADAAARSAAIPSPTVGMVSYLISTGTFEIYTDKTSPASWRPPWNTAWGYVAGATIADVTIPNSAIFLIPQTLPVNMPGRYYRVEFNTILWPRSGAATTTFVWKNGAATVGAALQGWYNQWNRPTTISFVINGAASNAFGLQASCDGGGANTAWARYRVHDVGGF